MPRGEFKQPGMLARTLGSEPIASGRQSRSVPEEQTRAAIKADVTAFAQAWFMGDAAAMTECLHPDFVNRMMGIQDETERRPGPEALVRSVVGFQGQFGTKIALHRRRIEVRVLEVGSRTASAVADLGECVLHVHLVRAGGRWSIVNAMWEFTSC